MNVSLHKCLSNLVQVVLGGGRRGFLPSDISGGMRKDRRNLIQVSRNLISYNNISILIKYSFYRTWLNVQLDWVDGSVRCVTERCDVNA